MNFADDDEILRAPVWDELNQSPSPFADTPQPEHPSDTLTTGGGDEVRNDENIHYAAMDNSTGRVSPAILNELSQAFNNVSTRDTTPYLEESTTAAPREEEPTSSTVADTQNSDKQQEERSKLINLLAPEADPLHELHADAEHATPPLNRNDPLFENAFVASPLPLNILNDTEKTRGTDDKKVGKLGKPKLLFNANKRLRRRPPLVKDVSGNGGENTTSVVVDDDPLKGGTQDEQAKVHPEKTTSDEPQSTGKGILEQMNRPLYDLSPRKSGSTAISADNVDVEVEEKGGDNSLSESKAGGSGSEEVAAESVPLEAVPFKVIVRDPIKVGELTSHIEYTVISESELLESGYSQVQRRYRDFRWLYRQLQNNHWGKVIPPPPEKQLVRRFNGDFIENRRFQIENMLRKFSSDPILQRDKDFLLFLRSDNFNSDSKLGEHMTLSRAYNDSNDLSEITISEIELLGNEDGTAVLKHGGLDAETPKGFIGLSFSSQPKYNEPEEYFNEEKARFENLEDQLRQLYKALELIDKERNELISTISEFSKSIEALASLEVTKKSSDILVAFSEVHKSIRESLERNSLQQSLTMGATLEEYIRLIASVKAIFNQRAKLGYYLVIVENEFNKKKAQFEKIYPNQRPTSSGNNDEKFNTLQREYQVLKTRHAKVKERWQKIGRDIKAEVKSFEVNRINEFRDNMEVSLESSIESQKEIIELWETFYQNYL